MTPKPKPNHRICSLVLVGSKVTKHPNCCFCMDVRLEDDDFPVTQLCKKHRDESFEVAPMSLGTKAFLTEMRDTLGCQLMVTRLEYGRVGATLRIVTKFGRQVWRTVDEVFAAFRRLGFDDKIIVGDLAYVTERPTELWFEFSVQAFLPERQGNGYTVGFHLPPGANLQVSYANPK